MRRVTMASTSVHVPGLPLGRARVVLALCTACGFLSVADRSTLSVLTIDMKKELHWTAVSDEGSRL